MATKSETDLAAANASIEELLTAAGCHPDHTAEANDMLILAEITVVNSQAASAEIPTGKSCEVAAEEDGCLAEAATSRSSDSQD